MHKKIKQFRLLWIQVIDYFNFMKNHLNIGLKSKNNKNNKKRKNKKKKEKLTDTNGMTKNMRLKIKKKN